MLPAVLAAAGGSLPAPLSLFLLLSSVSQTDPAPGQGEDAVWKAARRRVGGALGGASQIACSWSGQPLRPPLGQAHWHNNYKWHAIANRPPTLGAEFVRDSARQVWGGFFSCWGGGILQNTLPGLHYTHVRPIRANSQH